MRTLWRTTVYLFWQYPILWVPVLLADGIAFCLRTFQAWTTQTVIRDFIAGHSVLSDAPEPIRAVPVAWAIVFGTARALVELVNLCLYSAAMIAISILIVALLAQTKTSWRQVLLRSNPFRADVLVFTLKLFGMILVAAFLNIEFVGYLARLAFTFSPLENTAVVGIIYAAIAWLLAPSAIVILRRHKSPPTDSVSLHHARNFAAACILVSTAIFLSAEIARPSFARLLTAVLWARLYWMVASAATALPYILLFIALGLIANPDSPLAADPEPENLPA